MSKKYAVIFGTRPEYLKLKSVLVELSKRLLPHKVIYVSQHETIEETIEEDVEKLILGQKSHHRLSNIGCEILMQLPDFIHDCTDIIVQGDTATAFYSALTAFQGNKTVIHIEAGLRTYDLSRPFPEEAYRQMISRMATVHFTPHEDSSRLLKKENVSGNVYNVGNTILDLVHSYASTDTFGITEPSSTVFITFHRRENWDKIGLLLIGLKKLVKKTPELKYIWYLHPNPELQEKVRKFIEDIPSIELREPCNHWEFTRQMCASRFLITDSGGIQEEASFLGKHCIVLRASTERTHIPKEYITVLEDYSELDKVYDNLSIFSLPPCNVYGYGNSAKQIIDILQSN